MRVAVVLPRGCGFRPDRANSMETVVRTLAAHARSQSAVTLICDADQATAPDPRLLTVPPGLGGRARNRRIKALLETLQPDVVEYHQSSPLSEGRQKVDDAPSAPYRKSIQTILRVYSERSGSRRRTWAASRPAATRHRA